VRVGVSLRHATLGQLIGAQRPTVSLALADLVDEGALRQETLRGWILDRASLGRLQPDLRPVMRSRRRGA
jgi:DNA-binding GntR family transcriptional regulator